MGSCGKPSEVVCVVCNEKAEKSCGNCRLVNYCSVEHQKKDWKRHKNTCCPFVVKESDEFGRFLVASRNLEGRSLVIREAPFAFAPYDTSGDHVPKCLSCCVRMSDSPNRRCSTCCWPVCSTQCEEKSAHAHNECPIFAERKTKYPPPQEDAVYSSILIFRLLLQKKRNPILWKEFLHMEHHSKSRAEKDRCKNDDLMILENIREYLDDWSSINEEDIRQIIGRVSVNSFGVSRREEGKNDDTIGRGVFLRTGIVAHGCVPNAVWGISYSPNFEIVVKTVVGIKRGDMITPTYSDIWNSLGTYQRLVSMLERSHFICKCKRCVDPTELGTYLSAIKCPKCKTAFLLPLKPTDLSDTARWQCENCGAGDSQSTVVAMVDDIECEIEDVISDLNAEPNERTEELEQLFKKFSGAILHKNHFTVRKIEKAIVEKLFPLLESCTFDELNKFIFHCENLLRVNDVLTPGYCGHGGLLRHYLCQALIQKKAKAVQEKALSKIFTSTKQFNDHENRIDMLKKEIILHFENDPEAAPANK